jgi:GGDEF domain-containing protein
VLANYAKEFVEDCKAQAFRISGDEFVILLNQSSLEQFKLKTVSFEKCTVSFSDGQSNEKSFTVSVSFGIALSSRKKISCAFRFSIVFCKTRGQIEIIIYHLSSINYVLWSLPHFP